MELRSPVTGKRLRSYLRVTFFMIRKGLISKRKLVMDMNLMMKRGKIMGKALGNLVFHHHQHHHRAAPRGRGYGLQEYEFSCTTSPNPVFFHAKRARHNYFPCIGSVAEDDNEPSPTAAHAAASLPRIDYSPQSSAVPSQELPLSSSSPLSVRVSEYDVDEEEESGAVLSASTEVDDEAEEFIRRFYEQQRRQSRVALLQYEMDYQEMLARGR